MLRRVYVSMFLWPDMKEALRREAVTEVYVLADPVRGPYAVVRLARAAKAAGPDRVLALLEIVARDPPAAVRYFDNAIAPP